MLRWQRHRWRLFWRWKSGTRLGRPRLSAEVRELIATLARENPLWDAECIQGEVLTLRIAVSRRSIRRARGRGWPRPLGQTWRTLLTNHPPRIGAADPFTVQPLTFRTLAVLLFSAPGRRELVHFTVTANPTAAWVWRQVLNATPWGRRRGSRSEIALPATGRPSRSASRRC